MFKIRGTNGYDIYITRIWCPKNDLIKSLYFEFCVSSQFLLHLKKKIIQLSLKTRWRFGMIFLVQSIGLLKYIIKIIVLHEKCKNQHCTKMKFCIKDFFSECDQSRSVLRIWSHLLKKSLMKNFIFLSSNTCVLRWDYNSTHQ